MSVNTAEATLLLYKSATKSGFLDNSAAKLGFLSRRVGTGLSTSYRSGNIISETKSTTLVKSCENMPL